MARKSKKIKVRNLPNIPPLCPLSETYREIVGLIPTIAGEEDIYERTAGGHTGVIEVELYDGSIYRCTIEVSTGWEDWSLLGAECIQPASASDGDGDEPPTDSNATGYRDFPDDSRSYDSEDEIYRAFGRHILF
jgi:hypothetical protein